MVLPNHFDMNAHMDPSATQFLNFQPPLNENEQVIVDQSSSFENSNVGFLQPQTSMPQSNMYFPPNQFPTPNLQFQSHYGSNRVPAPYPPHAQQVHVSRYGFQSPINTQFPPFESQTSGSSKGSKKVIKSKNKKISQTIEAARKSRVWTTTEDAALAKAYLSISIDSIVGKDQTSEKLWSRIFKLWKEYLGLSDESQNNNEGRNINALSCHWGVIQAAVNKFHGLHEALERTPRSGTNADDVKEQALRMYREAGDGSEFRFIHCWEIMRRSAKWCSLQLTKTGSSKRQKVDDTSSEIPVQSTPITSGISTPQENEVSGLDNPTNDDRPPGRRQSKDNKKKMQEEKSVMDTLNNFKITLEKEFELREQAAKKDLEMKEKYQKLKEEAEKRRRKEKQRKEDLAILNTDLEKLQPALRAALRIRQAVILKELEDDGFFGDSSVNLDMEI